MDFAPSHGIVSADLRGDFLVSNQIRPWCILRCRGCWSRHHLLPVHFYADYCLAGDANKIPPGSMIMMRTSASDLRGIIMLGALQMTYVGYSDISRWCGGSDLEFTRYKHIRTPERPTAPFVCPYCWTSPIKVDSQSCTFRSGTIL